MHLQVGESAPVRDVAGGAEAVGDLYVEYSDRVYGLVRGIVRDHHEAEDVTQQVFAKLITRLDAYEDRGVPFVAWLQRVARNVALDEVRRRRPTPYEEIVIAGDGSDADAAERAHGLRAAFDALPDDQRSVMVLRHVLGLPPSEIAQRLGRSEASIHGLHHRGRRALQRELRTLELEPSAAA